MKALIISALLFFSLRAMSAEVGESLSADCITTSQTVKREAKAVTPIATQEEVKSTKDISK